MGWSLSRTERMGTRGSPPTCCIKVTVKIDTGGPVKDTNKLNGCWPLGRTKVNLLQILATP